MAKPDSWMPIYWADLWNDTRHLTAVEQCAYYNLLGSMWMHGASLPNDNDRLQRMSRVTEKEWRTVKDTVIAFFELRDGNLYQKRLGQEYEKASKAYNARSQHMANVNSKRKQSPSTVTETTTVDTTHNSHSSIEETDVRTSVARRKSTERKTRLENTWQPSEADHNYARSCNLDSAEIHTIAEQFRRYWTGPDAKNPRKIDWHRTWCNWVDRDAARVIANRTRSSGPVGNRPQPGGTLAAFARVAADLERQNNSSRMGRGFEGIQNQPESLTIGHSERVGNGATKPTTDARDGVLEVASGVENPDKIEGGNPTGFGRDGGDLREEMPGISSRRCEESLENTGRHSTILARVERTQGEARLLRQNEGEDSRGAAKLETGYLRRLA